MEEHLVFHEITYDQSNYVGIYNYQEIEMWTSQVIKVPFRNHFNTLWGTTTIISMHIQVTWITQLWIWLNPKTGTFWTLKHHDSWIKTFCFYFCLKADTTLSPGYFFDRKWTTHESYANNYLLVKNHRLKNWTEFLLCHWPQTTNNNKPRWIATI